MMIPESQGGELTSLLHSEVPTLLNRIAYFDEAQANYLDACAHFAVKPSAKRLPNVTVGAAVLTLSFTDTLKAIGSVERDPKTRFTLIANLLFNADAKIIESYQQIAGGQDYSPIHQDRQDLADELLNMRLDSTDEVAFVVGLKEYFASHTLDNLVHFVEHSVSTHHAQRFERGKKVARTALLLMADAVGIGGGVVLGNWLRRKRDT